MLDILGFGIFKAGFMGIIPAIIAAGGALASGAMGLLGGANQNAANRENIQQQHANNMEMATRQEKFQQQMSNSAHQREVADLKAAGLNPMLSGMGGSGASSTSGAGFSSGAAQATNELAPAVSSAMEAVRLASQVDATDSQVDLNDAQTKTQQVQQKNIEEQNKQIKEATKEKVLSNKLLEAQIPAAKAKQEFDSTSTGQFMNKAGTAIEKIAPILNIFNSGKKLLSAPGQAASDALKNSRETIVDSKTGEVLYESRGGKTTYRKK